MTDTTDNIKKLQLEIWLKKAPEQRLHQTLVDNEALFLFWKNTKANIEKTSKTKHY
jgi:hypothetical protein